MNDELQMLVEARPEVAPYAPAARLAARRKLTAAANPHGSSKFRRPYGIAIAGAAMIAAASVTAVTVLTPTDGTGYNGRGGTIIALPKVTKMSAAEVLNRAAAVADFHPRDDQFIKITWQATGTVTVTTKPLAGWTERNRGTTWISADGAKPEVSKIEQLKILPHPSGGTIPKYAYLPITHGKVIFSGPEDGESCVHPAYSTYASMKDLPDNPDGMRSFLQSWHPAGQSDWSAWDTVSYLLGGPTYMPEPQRAALLRAAGMLPDAIVTENVTDSAGRQGVAVGRISDGVRDDIVFDKITYRVLGTQSLVVGARNYGHAPIGSIIRSHVQLETSVVNDAPSSTDVRTVDAC